MLMMMVMIIMLLLFFYDGYEEDDANGFGLMLMLIWSGHRALAHGNLQTGSQAANFYDHNNYNHDIMVNEIYL